jgi:hypothetical protein
VISSRLSPARFKLVVFEESLEGKTAMMLNWITSDGVSNHALAELPNLRKRTDGFLWLDIPEWRDLAEEILTNEYRQSVKHLRGWDPLAV